MRFGLAVLIMLMPVLNSCLHPEAGAGRKLQLHTRLLDRGLQSDRFDPTPAATWISDIDHLKRIYERLKKVGRLENLKKVRKPRDHSKMLPSTDVRKTPFYDLEQ